MARILHFNNKKVTIKMISHLIKFILVYFLWITSSTAQFFDEGHTVRDIKNSINWLRCSVGQKWNYDLEKCEGDIVKLNHSEIEQALKQASEQLGGTWRLPTLDELESLVCKSCINQKLTKNISLEFHQRLTGHKQKIGSTQRCIGLLIL